MSEYEYILREGNVPLKNNLIRRIVRNVLGVFREKLEEVMKKEYSGELKEVAGHNSLAELFCRTMEEFLISGMAVLRKRPVVREGKETVLTEPVSPSSFFYNTDACDIRGWDIDTIGQVHRVDFNQWCKAFVKNVEDYGEALKLFQRVGNIKVTEMWRKEITAQYLVHDRKRGRILRVNPGDAKRYKSARYSARWDMKEIWRYYFMTDDGNVIASGNSPYPGGGHPYVLKCYPMLDGEIQSFVGDLIDQQRYTNRLITLYDWVIRASAKGVLLLPKDAVDAKNIRNVADQWGRFNGVIVYNAKPGMPEPRQISGQNGNIGISDLLEIQLKMLEDVSGVNGILRGDTRRGNVSGELYKSQTTNALYSLADLMETFMEFVRENAIKDALLMNQSPF